MGTKVKIGGVPFTITVMDRAIDVCHDEGGTDLWGQISYQKQSIRVLKSCPERELRTTIHEILHGIINEYRVVDLIDDKGEHCESAIDQLALGIAEVLESLNIKELKNYA